MQTIGSQRDIGLKVRFVAAVNQYLATMSDKQKRRPLGKQTALIFLIPSWMFHVQLLNALHHHILHSDYDMLEQARAFVLNELLAKKQVVFALHAITNENNSHGSFCSITSESKEDM